MDLFFCRLKKLKKTWRPETYPKSFYSRHFFFKKHLIKNCWHFLKKFMSALKLSFNTFWNFSEHITHCKRFQILIYKTVKTFYLGKSGFLTNLPKSLNLICNYIPCCWTSVRFLRGGGCQVETWSGFFQWYHFSHVRLQISWELVRLITLIGLNKLWISPKSLKHFLWASVASKSSFLVL